MVLLLSPSDHDDSESSKRFQASAEAYTVSSVPLFPVPVFLTIGAIFSRSHYQLPLHLSNLSISFLLSILIQLPSSLNLSSFPFPPSVPLPLTSIPSLTPTPTHFHSLPHSHSHSLPFPPSLPLTSTPNLTPTLIPTQFHSQSHSHSLPFPPSLPLSFPLTSTPTLTPTLIPTHIHSHPLSHPHTYSYPQCVILSLIPLHSLQNHTDRNWSERCHGLCGASYGSRSGLWTHGIPEFSSGRARCGEHVLNTRAQ